MSNYQPMRRPAVFKKLSELFQIAGIGSLFAGLAPIFAGLMGDFGGRDPWDTVLAAGLGVFLGLLFLALAFVTFVKVDRIEFDASRA